MWVLYFHGAGDGYIYFGDCLDDVDWWIKVMTGHGMKLRSKWLVP